MLIVLTCILIISICIAAYLKWRYGLYIVGITGGIASGKSLYCSGLKEAGWAVIDLDQLSHDIQLPGTSTWTSIVNEFSSPPSSIFNPSSPLLNPTDMSISRPYLASLVFADKRKLAILNRIMRWPILKKLIFQIFHAFFFRHTHVVFVEAPLLFESGLHHICDVVITIDCPYDDQLSRICNRHSCSHSEAEKRVASQMSSAEKAQRADILVKNAGSKQALYDRAHELILPGRPLLTKTMIILWICIVIFIGISVFIGDIIISVQQSVVNHIIG
uniref:Dephospho-CoA kinase n=1 Tax=Spongospora subterranea TaxID=70186 RepID=A0A0H5RA86_9EUKA|eukprot:CRZ10587.1 hypothetical protein [Spongospora subterranea]